MIKIDDTFSSTFTGFQYKWRSHFFALIIIIRTISVLLIFGCHSWELKLESVIVLCSICLKQRLNVWLSCVLFRWFFCTPSLFSYREAQCSMRLQVRTTSLQQQQRSAHRSPGIWPLCVLFLEALLFAFQSSPNRWKSRVGKEHRWKKTPWGETGLPNQVVIRGGKLGLWLIFVSRICCAVRWMRFVFFSP